MYRGELKSRDPYIAVIDKLQYAMKYFWDNGK